MIVNMIAVKHGVSLLRDEAVYTIRRGCRQFGSGLMCCLRAEDIRSQRKENQGWAVYPIITERREYLKQQYLETQQNWAKASKNTTAQTIAYL